MSFTLPVFFLFLPVVVTLYWLLPAKMRWLMLLMASYIFYMYWNPFLVILLLISTVVDYSCSLGIQSNRDHARKKKIYLLVSILMNLGLLFSFKYLNFFAQTVNALYSFFGSDYRLPEFHLILPVGISFYTFQTMSYTIDVYRGEIEAEKHFGHYALFVTFFPQLVAGPIERPKDLIPQLKQHHTLCRNDLFEGFRLLLRGYGKKVLIADFLAQFVDQAYGQVSACDGSTLAIATILFAIQIYCDFSGYSDIAQGCARLMGIRLSDNFQMPYTANSIRSFWRRWHISLTSWFTDYLYIPMGGSRKNTWRTCINIMITFLVSGLWHGANWTYVIWGGIHGLYLVMERLIWKKRSPGMMLTFFAVCFSWIFFRSATVADAFTVIERIFSPWQIHQMLTGLSMGTSDLLVCIACIGFLPLLEQLPQIRKDATMHRNACLYFLVILAIVFCRFLVLNQHGDTAFIYFQF